MSRLRSLMMKVPSPQGALAKMDRLFWSTQLSQGTGWEDSASKGLRKGIKGCRKSSIISVNNPNGSHNKTLCLQDNGYGVFTQDTCTFSLIRLFSPPGSW